MHILYRIKQIFDQKVFKDNISEGVFNFLLAALDHLQIEFVDRADFITRKNTNTLIQKMKDKDVLFLPHDLKHGELFWLIEFLNKEFGLQRFDNVNKIIQHTQVALGETLKQVLRDKKEGDLSTGGINNKQEFVKGIIQLAKEYGVSEEFIHQMNRKISFKELRANFEKLKKAKQQTLEELQMGVVNVIRDLLNKENLPDLSKYLKKIAVKDTYPSSKLWLLEGLLLETFTMFNTTFLDRGMRMLGQSLGVFTLEDLQQLCKEYEVYDDIFDAQGNIIIQPDTIISKLKAGGFLEKSSLKKLLERSIISEHQKNIIKKASNNKVLHLDELKKLQIAYINILLANKIGENGGKIVIRDIDLDTTQVGKIKKLRDTIQVDEYKSKLQNIRQQIQNIKDINQKKELQKQLYALELEATKRLYVELMKFPYQDLPDDYQNAKYYEYQPSQIVQDKKICCVGFALIGHSILSELGIQHHGLTIPKHSALSIDIGDKKYIFDAAVAFLTQIEEITIGEPKAGFYRPIKFASGKLYCYRYEGDPKKVLISHVYDNKGVILCNLGTYEEDEKKKKEYLQAALEAYNKAIELNPTDADVYNNRCL